MSISVFELLGIIILCYAIVPTILGRCLSLGVFSHGNKKLPLVALTFDDGPDPNYTSQVLDILRKHNAKATFFLVGKHAKLYPDLVRLIKAEGHSLGSHGYGHKFSWFQGPLSSIKEIREGNRLIAEITGERPLFFRPAWGVFNTFSFIYPLLIGQRIILWSLMSWDWNPRFSTQNVTRSVCENVSPGSVIIFHDRCTKPLASESGPAKLLEALPYILKDLESKNYQIASIYEMYYSLEPSLFKKTLLRLWGVWELCFEKLAGLKPIGEQNNNLFRLAVRKYRGTAIQLPDGTHLKPGDKICELHLNNGLLKSLTSKTSSLEVLGINVLKETKRSLPLLAQAISQDPTYHGIKALMGITMIHRGTTRLGFSVYDLSPSIRSFVAWYQRWLIFLLHPGGFAHLRRQWSKLVPKKVVISKVELLKRYLPEGIHCSDNGNTSPANGSINAR